MKIIIANTNQQALLKQVDNILKDYPKDDVPGKLKGQATLSALKSMFQGRHFSICEITDIAKMNGVHISREFRDYFHTLHCVDFSDMTQETREYLLAKCIDLFRDKISIANFQLDVGQDNSDLVADDEKD